MEHLVERSLLFVPGTKPELIKKALASGADAVIVDWEDAVAIENKADARQKTLKWLIEHSDLKIWIRMNAIDTPFYAEDIAQLLAICKVEKEEGLLGIVVPKVESAASLEGIHYLIQKPLIPMIENAQGIMNLAEIAKARSVHRLTFGGLDLALALGGESDREGMDIMMHYVRFQLIVQSILNGLPAPIETVYPHFRNETGLKARCDLVKSMGMKGMLAIHPLQIETIHQSFNPSKKERAWATAIINHVETSGETLFQWEGEMIDAPVIARARQLL